MEAWPFACDAMEENSQIKDTQTRQITERSVFNTGFTVIVTTFTVDVL